MYPSPKWASTTSKSASSPQASVEPTSHIYEWAAWARSTIKQGLTIGHEFVGEVVGVGSNVTDIPIGQLVSGEGHVVCGRCRNCLAGRRHLCAHTLGVGVNRNGAFAE